MKILQLGKAFPPVKGIGGVEKVIELFYYGLNNNKIDCDVLGVNDKFKYEIDNYCKNGKVYREKLLKKVQSTYLSLHLIFRLFKISDQYDIIHVHHPDPMSFLSIFLVRPKAKIVIHWHSDIVRQKVIYFFYQIIEKWMLRRADLILCTTPKYYNGNKTLKPFLKKTDYLVIGYKKDTINLNEHLLNSIQNSKTNRKQILFIGRLVYYKGLEYLIKSISLIKSFSYLCIIGEGEYFDSLKKLAKILKVDDKVQFLGNLNEADKIAYLKTSDILVLPSIFKSEAYGIVQVEAMAYGIPVISTKIEGSGIDWVNQNGITGITVPICDENSLAVAIDQILLDPSLHLELSTGAQNRFRQVLTEEVMLKNLLNFYRQILK
jgi:glycosyltransferase involved in cell wall biosynthesis